MPIPLIKVTNIKGALVVPINTDNKKKINNRGEIMYSKRLNQKQSKNLYTGAYLKIRVKSKHLEDYMYGNFYLSIGHLVVNFHY